LVCKEKENTCEKLTKHNLQDSIKLDAKLSGNVLQEFMEEREIP
jgi:hypothetical protein